MNLNPRKLAVLIACIAASFGLAACGSSSSSSSTSSAAAGAGASTGTAAFAASRSKFAACLKQHGVTLPARNGQHHFFGGGANGSGAPPAGGFFGGGGAAGGGFRSNPKSQAAFKACASLLPRGGRFFRSGTGRRRAAIESFVKCVRQHGYNLPTPNLSGTGPVFPRSIESNAKFRSASKACAKLLVPRGAPPQGAQPNA